MTNKKILITLDWFLPGTNSGGPVRSVANMVEQVPDFTYYILTRNTDYCSTLPYEGIQQDTWVQFSENVFVYYFSDWNLSPQTIADKIEESGAKTIYINGIYSRMFSQIPLKIGKKLGLNCIVAPRGMLSPHAISVKPLKKKLFLILQKLKGRYKGVVFHATSASERMDIVNQFPNSSNSSLIPNLTRVCVSSKEVLIEKDTKSCKLITLGRISPEKGTLEGLKALQNIRGVEIQYDLYGTRNDLEYWEECKHALGQMPANIKAQYCGTLGSDDVLDKIQEYHFLFSPSEGENYGHSIVEAFMAGRPVIIRDNTPWKNLKIQGVGVECQKEEMVFYLDQFTKLDNEDYQRILHKVKTFRDKTFNNQPIIDKYTDLFNS
ncbi:MAG: glycosyltransferase [Bacteroidetes bacterium]|nr:glycosyltransferase [Bacteroidota bacterium]